MCKLTTTEQVVETATVSTTEPVKYVQPPNPPAWKKAAVFPIWALFATTYSVSRSWYMLNFVTLATFVNFVLDTVTGGWFKASMEEFLNPKSGEPKSGMMKNLSEKLLNKKENYVHFAAIFYITIIIAFHWGSIIYLRANNIGGWMLPFVCHMYYMGAGFNCGANNLHYVAHQQVSNNQKSHMFKSELINGFCRYVLEPCQGYIPEFWLNHHVKIHHKESNGPDDIQGVTFFERKHYNFIWFVADIPLQWYVRGPVHHIRNGATGTAIEMIVGEILFVALGIMLTKWDFFAGICLFWSPHICRSLAFNSSNEYVQHALVDGRDGNPHDPANNSFLLLQPCPMHKVMPRGLGSLPDNFEERWHAVHHNFPHKGMVGQDKMAPKVKCNLIFDIDYIAFKNALLKRDMEKLAGWWRPGYNFGDDKVKVSQFAEEDKKLDLKGRAALLDSFLYPAYDLDEMGNWLNAPPFPFNFMELGPMQQKVRD